MITDNGLSGVLAVFGVFLSVALVRTMPALVKFYAWFTNCGLSMSQFRGYGQSACKFYGVPLACA